MIASSIPLLVRFRSWLFRWMHRTNRHLVVGDNLQLYCWLSIKGPGKVVIGNNCVVRALSGYPVYMVTLYTHAPEAQLIIGDDVHLTSARFACRFQISMDNGVVIEDAIGDGHRFSQHRRFRQIS